MTKSRADIGSSSSSSYSVKNGSLLPFATSNYKKNDDDKGGNAGIASTEMCGSWFQRWPRRWMLLFRRLPVTLQLFVIILGFILFVLGGLVGTVWNNPHPSFSGRDFYRQFRRRPVDIPHFPRIVILGPMQWKIQNDVGQAIHLNGGGDVTVARLLDDSQDRIPEEGSQPLIERYNPMPLESPPVLKAASILDKGKCQQMHDWQSGHNPTCNVIHEISWGFAHPLGLDYENAREEYDYDDVKNDGKLFDDLDEQFRYVAGGAFRWVWMIREYDGTRRVLKTLRVDSKSKHFDLRNFDRHRRDAVAMDQLTSSPLIVDMYGYCSNTGLYDWGEGGDLLDIFQRRPDVSKEELLKIAYNVSLSIHDAHHFDDQGRATMAHTDIKPDQFLYQDGYYRLTDFNRVRFLVWNFKENKKCGFRVAKNGGYWRAPEEYAYEMETEKVDVYSLGNVLYFMLMREVPWKHSPSKLIYEKVQQGGRPKISEDVESSTEIYERYMIEAMKQAWIQNASERPSAYQVAQILYKGMEEYEAVVAKGGPQD